MQKFQLGERFNSTYTLKILGCFNTTLGQIWTNPNIGLKM